MENLQKILQKMQELYNSKDYETSHSMADDLLIDTIQALVYAPDRKFITDKIIEAYNDLIKW